MTEAPINPAIALIKFSFTTRNKVVDVSVSSKDLLDSDATSDEKAQYEAKKSCAVCTLGLVKVKKISNDLSWATDVPNMS